MKESVIALVEHERPVGDGETVALDKPSLVDRRYLAAFDRAVVPGATTPIVGPIGRRVVGYAVGQLASTASIAALARAAETDKAQDL